MIYPIDSNCLFDEHRAKQKKNGIVQEVRKEAKKVKKRKDEN